MDEGEDERDAATQAFEDVRGELALLRRAIEGIAARDDRPAPPDYSETLARIMKLVTGTYQRAEILRKAGEEETVARQVASRINGAVVENRQAVKTAASELRDATRALQGVTVSARRAEDQKWWVMLSAIGGIVVGMMLWAVFAGVVARAVPASWQWPERMAAQTLGGTTWEGARRLAVASYPGTWNTMVAGMIIGQGNQALLERCQQAANKVNAPVRCKVRIKPK